MPTETGKPNEPELELCYDYVRHLLDGFLLFSRRCRCRRRRRQNHRRHYHRRRIAVEISIHFIENVAH